MFAPKTACFGLALLVMLSSMLLAQDELIIGPGERYETINDGLKEAFRRKKDERRSTAVVIRAGVYREFVDPGVLPNYPSNDPDNRTPISIRGEGEVIIKGSDVFVDWSQESDVLWSHSWQHAWGLTDIAKPEEAVQPADIVRRREVVFIDGVRLPQVPSQAAMTGESFFVDELTGRLFVSTEKDLTSRVVEVAVRERLYRQEFVHDVTMSNITFMHAATPWVDHKAAVSIIGSEGFAMRDVDIVQNNGRGLYVTGGGDMTFEAVRMNDNGWDGWGFWIVKDVSIARCETSRNNWRGHLGGYDVWRVGNKILSVHGLTIRDHLAEDNLSHGMWLDLDNTDVLLERVVLRGNLKSGIYIEANQGPITLTDSHIHDNGGHAVLVANSENVTIEHSRFEGNAEDWLFVSGASSGRTITNNHVPKADPGRRILLKAIGYTIRENRIEVRSKDGWVINNGLTRESFQLFYESLSSDANTYLVRSQKTFKVNHNDHLTLQEWRTLTGQDFTSELEILDGEYRVEPQDPPEKELPAAIGLDPAYPNPFSETATIAYQLPTSATVHLTLFDLQGRIVGSFHKGTQLEGEHEFEINGRGLPSGTYFLEMKVDGNPMLRSLTVAR